MDVDIWGINEDVEIQNIMRKMYLTEDLHLLM